MQLPIIPVAVFFALSLLAGAGSATAQDMSEAAALQRAVATARGEAVAASKSVRDELAALVPSVPGWTCEKQNSERRDRAYGPWRDVIPIVQVRCENAEHSLDLNLIFDPAGAAFRCKYIADKQARIDDVSGKRLFRFFAGGSWRVMRRGLGLDGCAADTIALTTDGGASEEAIARGPAAVDAFAEALLGTNPAPLLAAAESAGLEPALARLQWYLNAQSSLLKAMVPVPTGATRKETHSSGDPSPLSEILQRRMYSGVLNSPWVSADLDVGGCWLKIQLASSSYALYEARETGGGWGGAARQDGEVYGAFVKRNTGRVVGQEALDGTGIEAIVDGTTVVRVVIPGNRPCESDPEIVRRIFDEILVNDLSVFGDP